MDDREDPSVLFFGTEEADLYGALGLTSTATGDDIKKAYRKLALKYHPDKHASASEDAKAEAAHKFQQVGFAYAVLSDEKRRAHFDKTGRTDEGFEDMGEDGWEDYFADLFDGVSKERLDNDKREYQGSTEELHDIKAAYVETSGDLEEIMNQIPHSTHEDEARITIIVSGLVKSGELPAFETWEMSSKDEKARLVRKKQAAKEAGEAEELAKELGVWEEFYGSGKAGPRKGKGKAKAKKGEEDEDVSSLQALILKKQKNRASLFDNLAAKYAEPEPKGKGKRKAPAEDEDVDQSPPRKKKRGAAAQADPTEIDDAEFEKLQQKLFGDKDKAKKTSGATGKQKKPGSKRGRT
ncbi:DnaJ-domain-containing protein [Peniophora sp. CONT]|nr:DnaJ-domain-containing protein [Peniophora sp. CONT]